MIARLRSAQAGLMVLGLKAGEALLGAAMTIYLARIMGPSAFGFFAFGLATTMLLAIPIKNGASTLITMHVAIAHEASGPQLAGQLIYRGIRLSLLYAGLLLAGVWGARAMGVTDPFIASVSIVALALPFLCLTGLWQGVLRGSFQPKKAILVGAVLLPLAMLALAAMLRPQLAAHGWQMAGALYVGAAVAINLLALIWASPYLKGLLPVAPDKRLSAGAWIGYAAPFAVITGLLIFNRQINVILLGVLQGEEAAGIYRIAAQAAVLVTFGVQAIGHLYAPYLARIDKDDEPQALSKYLRRSALFSVTFGFLALAGLVLWGKQIIVGLAGPEYLPGYPVMLILCVANLAVALNGATMQALYMQGNQNRLAIIFGCVSIYTVIVSVSLVPLFGITGSAYATGSAIILWSLGARVLACRIWNLSFVMFAPRARP